MDNCLNGILIKAIPAGMIVPAAESSWRIGYGTDGDVPLFLEQDGSFHPVVPSCDAAATGLVAKTPAALFAMLATLRGGRLNIVEQLRTLPHVAAHPAVVALFSLDCAALERYRPVLALPDDVLGLVAQGRITPALALKLSAMHRDDASTFAMLVTGFGLNHNQQKDVLEGLGDLSRRDGASFKQIVEDRVPAPVRNGDGLRAAISGAVMPDLDELKRRFADGIAQLGLPPKTHVVPPPGFESKTLKLETFFKTETELRAALAAVLESIDDRSERWRTLRELL